jgi:phosphatidylglycerophosphate synthase
MTAPSPTPSTTSVIGVVDVNVAPAVARRIGGLALPLRALLALQQAGASPLAFTGSAAEAWAAHARADDRVRCAVEALTRPPEGPFVAVSGELAIDTRFARALLRAPGVVRARDEVVAVHRVTPSDQGVLVDAGDGALDVSSEGLCLPVRDDASARAADDRLYASLRKPQDGFISRAINRSLSIRVTRLLAPTGLRPNQVSVGILAFGVAGAVLAAKGTHAALAVAGMCFNAQSILDGCDGELARLTFRGSRTGEWIDTVGDDLTNYGFFAGAAWGLHRAGLGALPLLLGGVGLAAGFVASLTEYRYLLRIGSGDLLRYPLGFGDDASGDARADTGLRRLVGLARPLFKRDFFVFATMLAALAGPSAMLVMLALFAGGAAITLSAVLRSEWARRGVAPGQETRV